jgi:hypothetical protein
VPRTGRRSSVTRRPSLISGGQSNASRPEVQELAARAKDSAAAQLAVKLYETAVTGGDVGGIQAYVRQGERVCGCHCRWLLGSLPAVSAVDGLGVSESCERAPPHLRPVACAFEVDGWRQCVPLYPHSTPIPLYPPCPHTPMISGSDVNSFCCYGLVYLLDSW